jgi:hypothetical protein
LISNGLEKAREFKWTQKEKLTDKLKLNGKNNRSFEIRAVNFSAGAQWNKHAKEIQLVMKVLCELKPEDLQTKSSEELN